MSRPEPAVVDCNCAFLQRPDILEGISRNLIDFRLILIRRDSYECRRSLDKVFPFPVIWKYLEKGFARLTEQARHVYAFSSLERRDVCEGLLNECAGVTIAPDEDRWNEFRFKNIQQDINKLLTTRS
jgi:hypothetical protein